MIKPKNILSYLLLLVYTVSFGHQIIPHHHHENNFHSEDNTKQDQHCQTDNEAHNHIAHENHYDEGFIDYLACVLGSHHDNESHNNCQFSERLNQEKNASKRIAEISEIEEFLFTEIINNATKNSILFTAPVFFSHFLSEQTRRGPPKA